MNDIEAPRRIGIFKPWPAGLHMQDVMKIARHRVSISGIPTWIHNHEEDTVCSKDGVCVPLTVSGTGTYEDLVGSPGAFKV